MIMKSKIMTNGWVNPGERIHEGTKFAWLPKTFTVYESGKHYRVWIWLSRYWVVKYVIKDKHTKQIVVAERLLD